MENPEYEAAYEDSSASRDAVYDTQYDTAVLSSASEHVVVPYIEAIAAHKRAWKKNAIFNGRSFYSYATSLLEEMENYAEHRPWKASSKLS